ncbi:MAG: energy-coupling factor transporter transmembrane component T [Acutalibacteraceae bacterium]|nr:energy-coupling factor transporter transmembrane component T [Acutalibacteraceae bacterium]
MALRLDPRTKLYMIFVVSAIVMMSATSPLLWLVRIVMTIVPIILLISEKYYASALRFSLLYALAITMTLTLLSERSTGIFMAMLTGYCGIVSQFMPAIITAWYVVRTTKIDEFMSAMNKMHIPGGITISLAVVMRFFPTIKEEYASISDAMKMRGITFGRGNALKMIEYRMIPVLFSYVNIGDELTAAAITRGLGGKTKRTSVVELKPGIAEYLLGVFFTAAAAFFLFIKYVK